jgi:hypothetical protein
MSRIDKMIAGDLAALAENSRRDVPALDEALKTTDAYRDDRPGAEARRNALADERRRELVLMPLTLSHVFAHRVGRIAAGGMAMLAAVTLMMMVADPMLTQFAAWLVPGLNVGMLMTIAALGILASYVIATWIAEAWFARKMRAAVQTGDDAYKDIDHLARGPLEIAHAAVQKVDAWSVGLVIAGFTSVTIAFGYVVVVVGMHHTISNAWSINGILDTGALERNIEIVMMAMIAAISVAALVGRACLRGTVPTSTLARALGGWPALAVTAVVVIATLYNSFHMLVRFQGARRLPTEEMRFMLALGASICVFVPIAWGTLFWRRREQARIGL